MRQYFIFMILLCSAFIPPPPLFADVIITKDDMILNGKIIEDKKPKHVKFANYHGNFTIKYSQIKEIHRTESFEDDIRILQGKGKSVNEDEVNNNYKSGMKKLDAQRNHLKTAADQTAQPVIMLNVFSGRNFGKLDSVLPYSGGVSLSAEIPVPGNAYFEKFNISGIHTEADYFYSEKDERSIKSFSGAAGPFRHVPAVISGYSFYYNISAAIGIGWYSVKNASEEASGAKWNLILHAGPVFDISSVIISPQFRLEYIYDGAAPLYCAGLSLGAGYKF